MLEIGSVIDGKYKILNKIGQGGMSVVYLAMNEKANKQWAIKEIRKDGKQDIEIVKQNLIAETDILKKLNHPNLPSIIDVIDKNDTLLIVMDYIEGNSLSSALKEYGAQPQDYVIEWAKQLCDVLGYLHSRKPPIIYRDLKPSNIMLQPNGQICLIDFGTAKEFANDNVEETSCLGTRGFAAPEQYGGRGRTDARTDIYCLGATLYNLVTGKSPAEPPYEMKPIRMWNPALSSGLEEIILKCTKQDPAQRYQSCSEIMFDLEHYQELDKEYKVKRKHKLTCFMMTALLSVIMFVAAGFARYREGSIKVDTYQSFIEQAGNTNVESDIISNYKKAIELDPSDEEAYLNLLKYYTENDDDAVFTDDESKELISILNTKYSGNKTNEEMLQGNASGYAKFAYEMGKAYWYNYGSSDSEVVGQVTLATRWFNKVQLLKDKSNNNEYENAKIYAKIGDYYTKLGTVDKAGDATVSYADYWNDLKSLYEEPTDNQITRLYMMRSILYSLFKYTKEFKEANVSQKSIMEFVNRISQDAAAVNADSDRAKELLNDIEQYVKQVDAKINGTY